MEQQQYDNIDNVRGKSGSHLNIHQRIKYSLPIVIRILAYVQKVLSLLIFVMEIGIIICYSLITSLPTTQDAEDDAGPLTAVGIWTSIVMDIAIYFLFKLAKQINERRMWIINVVTQSILFLFAIILIGITGNYVDRYSSLKINYSGESRKYLNKKYQLHQAQLAFAILMFFSAILFIGLFVYLYLIARSFSESTLKSVNLENNNNPPRIQQHQISQIPPPSENHSSMATASDVVLKEIQYPYYSETIPSPIFKGTYIPNQQSYAKYVPAEYNEIRL